VSMDAAQLLEPFPIGALALRFLCSLRQPGYQLRMSGMPQEERIQQSFKKDALCKGRGDDFPSLILSTSRPAVTF
jgi:hypothetical protein